MLAGVISAMLVLGVGNLALRSVRVARGPLAIGLAPPVGIAVSATITRWMVQVNAPEELIGVVMSSLCVVGLALLIWESTLERNRLRCHRLELGLLLLAAATTLVVLGQALSIRDGIPDYVHDGAHHAETVDALRHGTLLPGWRWYPIGFHGPVAALLALAPWVDSATGVVGWGAGLTILAPLAMFGLAMAVWHDARIGAAAATLLAVTYSFPYEQHLYSTWPMLAGLVLVIGLWTVTVEYLREPDRRLALAGGLMAGAMLLTHGTEIYTAIIGLVVLAAASWRTLVSRRVAVHLGLAAAAALACAAPYFPAVMGWTASGGAVATGTTYFEFLHGLGTGGPLNDLLFWSSSTSSGLLMDLPARLALLGLGAWLALRKRAGAPLVILAGVFALLVAMSRYVDIAPTRAIFALTLPWAVDGRLLMTVPILVAPLEGLAAVHVGTELMNRARAAGVTAQLTRRQRMARRALVLGLATGVVSIFLVGAKFYLQTSGVVTFSDNDALAFAWLRQHAQPGDVLLNDGAADAGIWAPYKGNVSIVFPRTLQITPDSPQVLVRGNLASLATRADVRQAACTLGIRYVYRGEAPSPSEYRQFPTLAEMRANPALEEVFSSGEAAIFQTRLDCA